METEKDGAVQSDSIENADGVEAVAEEVKTTTEAPVNDDVQKLESLNKLISEREKAAEEKAAKHFQSVKDKEVAAEKRLRLEAERTAKLNQAHIEAQRELLLSGLTDPQERAEAERRYNAHVARKQEELNKPSPEMLQEVQRMNEYADDARFNLRLLKHEYGINYDMKTLKCSHPEIDMTTPETAFNTSEALLTKLKSGTPKAETKAEEPKAPKKAPKVDEGGGKSSGKREYTVAEIDDMSVDEYAKQKKDIDLARKEGRIK